MNTEKTNLENENPALSKGDVSGMCFSPDDKLDFNFLYERGFIATCAVGAGNTIFNKWGFELDIHCNFIYCIASMPRELINKVSKSIRLDSGYQMPSIHYKSELIELEKLMNIDNTPLMSKMSVEELKRLLPPQYEYILNKRKKYKKSEYQRSYSTKRGRYKIIKGDEVISEGYNDEEEGYFLCHSLLYILKQENLLPKNSIGLKHYR